MKQADDCKITRYSFFHGVNKMCETHDGKYVRYEDISHLLPHVYKDGCLVKTKDREFRLEVCDCCGDSRKKI